MPVVISDTSCLIFLIKLDKLALLLNGREFSYGSLQQSPTLHTRREGKSLAGPAR